MCNNRSFYNVHNGCRTYSYACICITMLCLTSLNWKLFLAPVLRTELSVMGCKVEYSLLILVHSLMNWCSTLGTHDATHLEVC